MDMTRGEFLGLFTIAIAKLFGYEPERKTSGFTPPEAPAEPMPLIYGNMEMEADGLISKGSLVEVVPATFKARVATSRFPDDYFADERGNILRSESVSCSASLPGMVRRDREYLDGTCMSEIFKVDDYVKIEKKPRRFVHGEEVFDVCEPARDEC